MQVRLINLNELSYINNNDYLNIYYKLNVEETDLTYKELIGKNKEIVLETFYSTNSKDFIFNGNKYYLYDLDTEIDNLKDTLFQTITSEILQYYIEQKNSIKELHSFKINLYNEKSDPFLSNPIITFIITTNPFNIHLTNILGN